MTAPCNDRPTSRVRPWQTMAAAGDIGAAVVNYVSRNDWVTVVELQRRFEPYTETRGDGALIFDHPRGGLVVWAGLGHAFCDVLAALIADTRVHVWPCHPFAYAMDGGMLALPIAKRPPKRGYREPHWLPISLRPIPRPRRRLRAHEC